jgi:hypothetical protein
MPIDDEKNPDLISSDVSDAIARQDQEELKAATENIITCAFDCSEMDIVNCRKCSRPFCIMHSNRFSPNFCKECFANLACIEDKFTRTFEDYNEVTEKLTITRQSCTKYYMDGPDWPFFTPWIASLSDTELRSIWNFHFFVMKTIEVENEVRRIKKLKKLREEPTPKIRRITSVAKSTTTKIVQPPTPEELRKILKKQGLPDIYINQMIAAMGGE